MLAKQHLKEIIEAENKYFIKYGTFVSAQPLPQERVGSKKIKWQHDEKNGFSKLGWSPGYYAYCRYGVNATIDAFTVEIECDMWASGKPAYIGYIKPSPDSKQGIIGPFGQCATTGVYASNRSNLGVLETIGPCDSYSGSMMDISIFAGKND